MKRKVLSNMKKSVLCCILFASNLYIGFCSSSGPVVLGTFASGDVLSYSDSDNDFYVPIFSLLRFVFYFGWLHVASVLLNPFGEDDEDFDLNHIIDRNIQVGFMLVEEGEELQEEQEERVLQWPPVEADENENQGRKESFCSQTAVRLLP